MYAKDQLPDIERTAALSPADMLAKRDALHAEVDDMMKAYGELERNPATDDKSLAKQAKKKEALALEITKKQMEINFYSEEAYIAPGAPLTNDQRMQAVLSNLEMMEHVIKLSGHDLTKAWKEYELYKYMYRISSVSYTHLRAHET